MKTGVRSAKKNAFAAVSAWNLQYPYRFHLSIYALTNCRKTASFAFFLILCKTLRIASNRLGRAFAPFFGLMRLNRMHIETEEVTKSIRQKETMNWNLHMAKRGFFTRFCTLFGATFSQKSHVIFSNTPCCVGLHSTLHRATRHGASPKTAF